MKGVVYVLIATFCFSTMEVSLKLISSAINPLGLVFFRFFIAGMVLLPLALRRCSRLNRRDFLFFAAMGLLCVVISMLAYQLAIDRIPASAAAILMCCNPAFTAVTARLILREPVRRAIVLAIALSVAGSVCILNPKDVQLDITGVVLALFSAAVFSFYSVFNRKYGSHHDVIFVCCIGFVFGSAEMLLIILVGNIPLVARGLITVGLEQFSYISLFEGVTMRTLPALLYTGVCVTGLGYVAYFRAMEIKSAAFASIAFFIKPVLATLISCLLLKELVAPNVAWGIVLIVIGSAVILYRNLQAEHAGAHQRLEG